MIADRVLRYDPACYFVASMEVPASGCIAQASADAPYVGVTLALDRGILAALLPDAQTPVGEAAPSSFGVGAVTPDLLDAAALVTSADAPADARARAAVRARDPIVTATAGRGVAAGALADSRLSQIRRAMPDPR
jgi:hypothetical protein